MPYMLRITKKERDEFGLAESIPLADWKNAVSAIEGVRLRPPRMRTGTNPKTGEVINIMAGDGDVEVYFPDERVWHQVFRWGRGSAKFTVKFKLGDLSQPAWVAAVALASRLGVAIRGENGEFYDLQTGMPEVSGTKLGSIDYSMNLREYRIKFERVPKGEHVYPPGRDNLGLRSKLGGDPDWVQGNDTPVCSECGEAMTFIGQIDSIDHKGDHNPHRQKHCEQDFMFGDVGIIYVFFCFDCSTPQ
ncbi:MAG TPA: hypothetical protein VNX46_07980, partial [Candidatus Acidoferrum sp.]|nr:hypothetical protein [Candidatus Acidoferrum sp.]